MHISLTPEVIFHIVGFPVTNSLLLATLATLLLLGGGFFGVRALRPVPGKLQNAVEIIISSILDFMADALGDQKQARQFFPLVAAFFLLILFNNWLGLVPGVGSLVVEQEHNGEHISAPLFRAATSDLNATLALALVSVVAVQLYGISRLGIFGHLGKFFVLTRGPLHFFVGFLELIGELAKVMSFSFRLFGNIFAGEVLLITIMTLVPLLAPVPFFGLELFVGFIQALVFAMLTLVFLKIATETVEHA